MEFLLSCLGSQLLAVRLLSSDKCKAAVRALFQNRVEHIAVSQAVDDKEERLQGASDTLVSLPVHLFQPFRPVLTLFFKEILQASYEIERSRLEIYVQNLKPLLSHKASAMFVDSTRSHDAVHPTHTSSPSRARKSSCACLEQSNKRAPEASEFC
jgi:hypothetical protein